MKEARGAVVVLGLLLAALVPRGVAAQEEAVSLPLGTAAPSATVEDLDGNQVDLLDAVKGKPALIEFWATWCRSARSSSPSSSRSTASTATG